MSARFIVGDVFDVLAGIPDATVDLVLTSPPFLALRSYLPADHPDKAKEIGSEATPADFLDTLLALTEEWGRVLAPHGSICVELGDTYSGSGGAGGDYNANGLREGQSKFDGSNHRRGRIVDHDSGRRCPGPGWPLDKSLTLIPGLYAASLAYGRNLLNPGHTFDPWRVRNLVAWVRPNPPVGALGDKVRPATSYLTWATRARDRWFDLDAVRGNPEDVKDQRRRTTNGPKNQADPSEVLTANYTNRVPSHPGGAPPLDWWAIPPGGYKGAHYAVFPPELCRIPIEASCPRRVCVTCGKPSRREVENGVEYAMFRAERNATYAEGAPAESLSKRAAGSPGAFDSSRVSADRTTTGWSSCGCPGTDGIRLDGYHTGNGWRPGLVLDPFAGTATTGVVASGLSRDFLGIDIDARNADLARERVGMWLEVEHAAVREANKEATG